MSKKYSVEVEEGFCKGCGLCADICPAEVFSMSEDHAVVEHPERCLGCGRCELFCPDMAITVSEKMDEESDEEAEGVKIETEKVPAGSVC